jgi:putative FmdB family regulatory protein
MPIFEYKCDDCGTLFEKLVRNASQATELVCPSCGEKHLSQQLSTFAARVGNGGSARAGDVPMCPSGRPCPTPGACGLN